MKKITALVLAIVMALSLVACGGGSGKSVMSTEGVTIDAVCVNDAYRDDDESPLRMLYVFMSITPAKENLKVDCKYTDLIIDGANTYTSEWFDVNDYADSYYYRTSLEDVFVGTTFKLALTFKVPEGDLVAGKTVTLNDDDIVGLADIHFKTDDIQHFSSDEDITKAVDPEGYASAMTDREPTDADTAAFVKNYITKYKFSLYMNYVNYALTFKGNTFTLTTQLGSNSGSYVIQKGYIACTYDSNGHTVEIPYVIEGDKVDLDTVAAFSVS